MPHLKFLLAAFATLLLAACGGSIPPVATDGFQPPVYRLASGDRLNITVFGEEALSREYVITSAGDLSFPLLGDLPAAGLTPVELRQAVVSGLSSGYLNDPRVNVEVLNFRPFYMLGEVSKAGEYPYSTDLTVDQAVALAGGFTYRAEKRRVSYAAWALGKSGPTNSLPKRRSTCRQATQSVLENGTSDADCVSRRQRRCGRGGEPLALRITRLT